MNKVSILGSLELKLMSLSRFYFLVSKSTTLGVHNCLSYFTLGGNILGFNIELSIVLTLSPLGELVKIIVKIKLSHLSHVYKS